MDIFIYFIFVYLFSVAIIILFILFCYSQILNCVLIADIAFVIDMETSDPSSSSSRLHSSFPALAPVLARTSSPSRYCSPSRAPSPLPFSAHTSSSSIPAYASVPASVPFSTHSSSSPVPPAASTSVSVHGVTANTHTHTLNNTRLPKVHVPQGIGALGFGAPYLTAPWGQKILSTVYQSYVG